MRRRRISSGSPWEEKAAYSRAVVDGDWCFVSGTTGPGADGSFSDDAGEQARKTLERIASVLQEGGFAMTDVVRAVTIVTDRDDIPAVMAALRHAFADIRPTSTMVVAGLVEPAMKVEIEVTAKRGG